MDRSPHYSKNAHRARRNRLLQHPQTGLITVPASRANNPPAAKRGRQKSTFVLIFGLVILQAVTLLAALTIVSFKESRPSHSDDTNALNIPSTTSVQPISSEPLLASPPTVLIQQPNIVENQTEPEAHPAPATILTPSLPSHLQAVRVRGAEITQGIQVFQEPENARCQPRPDHPDFIFCNNSMPMVAKRRTLLRVYLACSEECPAADTIVRLRVLKNGQEKTALTGQFSAQKLQQVSSLTIHQLRANLDHSINFQFWPVPDWLSGEVSFQLEALPRDQAGKLPATLALTKDFIERKTLRIAYLPVVYRGQRPPEPVGTDYWLQRIYPVPEIEYYRLPMPDLIWEGEVNKGEILRKLLYTYWLYAQYHPAETRPDQLFGWLPQELYNGGASDPFWCPNCAGPHSSRVAFGGLRPEQDIGGPRILVHEIAHNLGAQHAWSPTSQEDAACFKAAGTDIEVDPDWPYAATPYIQEFGIDLYSDPPVIYPPSSYDMMAYCAQPWISPHTYQKIFESPLLDPDDVGELALSPDQPRAETGNHETLLISGLLYPDGTVAQSEIVGVAGDVPGGAGDGFTSPVQLAPPPGDDYCMEVQNKAGAVLVERCFEAGFLDLETGSPVEASPFFLTLPNIRSDEIDKIIFRKDQVAVTILSPSNHPPEVTVDFPNGGDRLSGFQTITWTASDADGDSLSYDLLYSPDAGQSWLPLAVRLTGSSYTFHTIQIPFSDQGLIRVVAKDGFHTVSDEADDLFTVFDR